MRDCWNDKILLKNTNIVAQREKIKTDYARVCGPVRMRVEAAPECDKIYNSMSTKLSLQSLMSISQHRNQIWPPTSTTIYFCSPARR